MPGDHTSHPSSGSFGRYPDQGVSQHNGRPVQRNDNRQDARYPEQNANRHNGRYQSDAKHPADTGRASNLFPGGFGTNSTSDAFDNASRAASVSSVTGASNAFAQPFGFSMKSDLCSLLPMRLRRKLTISRGSLTCLAHSQKFRKAWTRNWYQKLPKNDFLKDVSFPIDVVPTLVPLNANTPFPMDLGLRSGQFDVSSVRRDFPILQEQVFGHPLVWFDNAATTQKPNAVIDRLDFFYSHENSNIHRSAHALSAKSSDAYEAARESVRRFLNARSTNEIVFVRGATEAINLVAQSWGRKNLKKDDEVVISHLEHHANIVPWQIVCAETGARLRVVPVTDRGDLNLEEFESLRQGLKPAPAT